MKKIHGLLLLCLSLSGCATWERYSLLTGSEPEPAEVELAAPEQQKARPQYFVSPALYDGAAYQATQQSAQKLQSQYQPQAAVNVNHYVQSMMHDLVANLDLVNPQMVIGMTSFVYLDGPFDQTDLLGNQLSESFMHEVHQFGLGVIDFKTTDYIRVTPQGDFVFSRDFMELKEEQPIEFVLGGTLVRHQGGTLINARLVSVASKKVAATAQGFIPQNVVDALYQSGGSEKLLLKQGE
ncbi:FlgO family outer membrane protein [Rheinheimera texasensis]|uniref:FlgO family outer membrane protein n=1 Tax=Rheinheimera texasensis TaxID=306205 RepID=UPI0032B177AB